MQRPDLYLIIFSAVQIPTKISSETFTNQGEVINTPNTIFSVNKNLLSLIFILN